MPAACAHKPLVHLCVELSSMLQGCKQHRPTPHSCVLQARKNAKAAGQPFYDVSVLQALAGTLGSALPESLRPRACALSPHQVVFRVRDLAPVKRSNRTVLLAHHDAWHAAQGMWLLPMLTDDPALVPPAV
jgi:hypothetical protein